MVKLFAFGDPRLEAPDGPPLQGITRQTKRFALLIFLACDTSGRSHRREEITSIFWPESDGAHARNSLRQALHFLRTELGTDILNGTRSEDLWVSPSELSSDVETFTESITSGKPETALELYRDDFLLGFGVSDCPEFGAWADERRSNLRATAAMAAKDLAHQAEGKLDAASALFWWRRALLHRPFDEEVIRRIGSLLAWEESRGQALEELRSFDRRMRYELGVSPSPATLALIGKISSGRIDEITQWVGDRRGTWERSPEAHWRRPADH